MGPLAAPRPTLCAVVSSEEESSLSPHSQCTAGPHNPLLFATTEQPTWPCFLGHLPTQDLGLLLGSGSRDKACGHDKDVSACSLPARALLQLHLHLNAALGQCSEHPPDLCGVPNLPRDQECTVQGARLSIPSSYPYCKPGE